MSEYKQDPITGLYPYDTIYHIQENGDLIQVGYRLMDPFCPEEELICRDPDYFMRYYGLTKGQVWNICHGFDKDFVHTCPECGDELYFRGFSRGAFGIFCSGSCRQSYQLKERWKDPEYREYTLKNSVHSPSAIANRNRTEFLDRGDEDDECYLYLAWSKEYGYEWIKFGVSDMDPYHKMRREGYSNIHILIKDTRLNIANIECELSKRSAGEWFTPSELNTFKTYLKELLKAGNSE